VFLSYLPNLDFGWAQVGGVPAERSLSITSVEPLDLSFELIEAGGGVFDIGDGCSSVPGVSGELECSLPVYFAPSAVSVHTGRIGIIVPGEAEARPVDLSGEGIPLNLSYPEALPFGTVFITRPFTQDLVIEADQPAPISLAIIDNFAGAYATPITACDWLPTENGLFQCRVPITMDPPDVDTDFFATLGIFVNGEAEPRRVLLSGRGALLLT
jgi:hypothetical protein